MTEIIVSREGIQVRSADVGVGLAFVEATGDIATQRRLTAERLMTRFATEITSNEFLELALKLPAPDREWLANQCVNIFRLSRKIWFGEVADKLAQSLGFTSADAHLMWTQFQSEPNLTYLEEQMYAIDRLDAECIFTLCLQKLASTGRQWFIDAATVIAFRLGYPSVYETDWGPYRDGETGPSSD